MWRDAANRRTLIAKPHAGSSVQFDLGVASGVPIAALVAPRSAGLKRAAPPVSVEAVIH